MKAAWYEKQGPALEVFRVGEMPDPLPAASCSRTFSYSSLGVTISQRTQKC
jgi:hypothetical protein